MKSVAFAFALLTGSAALAQTGTAYDGDGAATAPYETDGTMGRSATAMAATVQPSNAAPERDARGIAVISDAATVPAGWNGNVAGEAMGGPLLDPVTGEPAAPAAYPACTRTVTDHCLQTYERRRR